ncbi:MAG: hypothetical protein PHN75_04695 [Syntrophales bacterium]|nr:hypothetical protein [Syntrophales bacterium]
MTPDRNSKFAMKYLHLILLIIFLSILLSSCTNLINSTFIEGNSGAPVKGLVYALPKGQVQIMAERKSVTTDDVKKAEDSAAKAKTKFDDRTKALNDAKQKLSQAKDNFDGIDNKMGDTTKDKLKTQLEKAQAVVNGQNNQLEKDKQAAESTAKAASDLKDKIGDWIETVSITQLPVVPDPTARYTAELNHWYTRDDNLKLTTSNGILSSSSVSSTDQMPNIILSLAQAIAAFGGVLPPTIVKMAPTREPTEACKGYSYSKIFDPAAGTEVKQVQEDLKGKNAAFELSVESKNASSLNKGATTEGGCIKNNNLIKGVSKGLVYRAPIPVQIRVSPTDVPGCISNQKTSAQSTVVVVPDSASAFVISVEAGAFTTSNYTLAFKDGMPTDFNITRPSEVNAFASIPVNIAKALISIPTELIKLRFDYNSEKNAIIGTQTDELKAQLDLLKAQRDLDAEKVKSATSSNVSQ